MVAGDHDDGQFRALFVGADDEVVQPLLGFDQQVTVSKMSPAISSTSGARSARRASSQVQEAGVFEVPLLAMEVLAQVPVGGVEQTQGATP